MEMHICTINPLLRLCVEKKRNMKLVGRRIHPYVFLQIETYCG